MRLNGVDAGMPPWERSQPGQDLLSDSSASTLEAHGHDARDRPTMSGCSASSRRNPNAVIAITVSGDVAETVAV